MFKITLLKQGRGNKNLVIGSNFDWCTKPKKKCLHIMFGILLIIFLLPSPTNLGAKDPEDSKKEKIIGYEEWHQLDSTLFLEVENYIEDNSFGSQLSGRKFIEACYGNNFDLVLALSQAHIESHFGTRGVASRTNSVFNVGTFDNGTILYRYTHPDFSVLPYISLMKRSYLVENKTAEDLLRPRSFVNYKGRRYASLKYYENRVKGVYEDIERDTPIDSLWKVYSSPLGRESREVWTSSERLYDRIIHSS